MKTYEDMDLHVADEKNHYHISIMGKEEVNVIGGIAYVI